ncbi:MAG: hypothetical protein AAGH60_03340 [Pseudomonadota bacterium]
MLAGLSMVVRIKDIRVLALDACRTERQTNLVAHETGKRKRRSTPLGGSVEEL